MQEATVCARSDVTGYAITVRKLALPNHLQSSDLLTSMQYESILFLSFSDYLINYDYVYLRHVTSTATLPKDPRLRNLIFPP